MTTVRHFDRRTIDALEVRPYANHPSPGCARFFQDICRGGVGLFVENANRTSMEVIVVDDLCIPIVINDGAEDSCYFVSPLGHYVRYAREEVLRYMKIDAAAAAFVAGVTALGGLGRVTGFNRHVSVNNWLFSSNPPLSLTTEQARAIVHHLAQRFPTHSVVFRSVNEWDLKTRASLEEVGCLLIRNRDLYTWDPASEHRARKGVRFRVRSDARFLARTYRRREPSGSADYAKAASLYRKLYCEKHSQRNARLTGRFFESAVRAGAFELEFLEAEGEPRAFVTRFEAAPHVYALFVGYDPGANPRLHRQYRSAVAAFFDDARARGRALFLSTGAAQFKRLRGAQIGFEDEAVWLRHLPRTRHLPWRLLQPIYARAFEALQMDRI